MLTKNNNKKEAKAWQLIIKKKIDTKMDIITHVYPENMINK